MTMDKQQHVESSFDRRCAPSRARRADGARYEELTWGQLRDQGYQRDYGEKESEGTMKTRLATADAAKEKRNLEEVTQKDGKRGRAPARGVKVSDNPNKPVDLVGNREWAPAEGMKASEILAQQLDSTRGGGHKDTPGSGKGKH